MPAPSPTAPPLPAFTCQAPSLAGLDHVTVWIFDLDNTLYPATSSLFPQIDRRMKGFISERLKLSEAEAFALQKDYFRRFGTTLRGLMLNHDVAPAEFLDYVHDVDHTCLIADPRLDAALGRLEGRKLVFTNGSQSHAEAVLLKLGLERHFEAIFDIIAADYVPKPVPETYLKMTRRHGIDPREALFAEDSHLNLKPAHEMGMATAWVRSGAPDPFGPPPEGDLSHCQHVVRDLAPWLARVVDEVQAAGKGAPPL
ncbi:pyrimidine 5'-nucleotidase [Roseospirillum parvum]|uniref:Putative hydrolase of the HAD superfamily n=1 Tax=Roseospirillum parvum TaxID=83401 RepID=A0A1G7VZL5_9PROT|nr:pyrimidine 5'-nucleotidase [Roseospirillum parvum]SDG65187.1 putative hydrolase of the HAD superfamily [Roseospirillum parvum]